MALKQKKALQKKPSEELKVKTYEQAEAVELTKEEQEKLSRSMLLRWFQSKKYEKLKGLQEKLIALTFSEREELKKNIIENTKKELEKHKELTEKQRQEKAEKFAQDLLQTVEGIANVKIVAQRHEQLESDEQAFYSILDGFVAEGKEKKALKKILQDKQLKSVLGLIASENPQAAKKIEYYINNGDYESLKKELVRASSSLPVKVTEGHVDQIMAMSFFKESAFASLTGIDVVDTLIAKLDKMRHVGHGFMLSKAAKDLEMGTVTVMRLGKYTLNEIKTKDDVLQRHRHLISDKAKKSNNDVQRLAFIDGVHRVVQKIQQKESEKGLRKRFKESLDKYLDSKEGLSAEDKERIKIEAKFEDLKLLNIFTLIYSEDDEREKIFAYSMSRVSKMYKHMKTLFGEERVIRRTLRKYHAKRITRWANDAFTKNAKTWKLTEIAGDLERLHERATSSSSKLDDLQKRVHDFQKYEKNSPKSLDPQELLHKEMAEHDLIHKDYQRLVQKATKIMSKQGKELVTVGKHLEVIQKNAGKGFLNKKLKALPHISDDSLRTLFPNKDIGKLRKTLRGGDLMRGYTNRLVDLKTMQDVTRTRFAGLANTIEETVATPFGKKWGKVLEKAGHNSEVKKIRSDVKALKTYLTPKGKLSWAARNLTLPTIVVGAQAYNLFTGKTQTREALWDLGEAGAGFVPFIGTALDLRGLLMGESLSGKKLSGKERAMYGVFATIGLVADAATLLGGFGLGMRASLGGMRSARRAVKIGKKGKTVLQQSESASKLFGIQKWIAGGARKFNKLSRAERATDLLVAGKAMEQARLMDRLKQVEGFASAKLTSVDDIEKLMKVAKTGDQITDLKRLKNLMHKTGAGIDYLKIARKYGKKIKVPENFVGKLFFTTKEAFTKMKAKLLKIGVPKEMLQQYERTYDVVSNAKRIKADAVQALADIHKAKKVELAERARTFENLKGKGEALGDTAKKYADVVEQHKKIKGKFVNQEAKYKSLKRRYDSLVRKKASKAEIDDAYDAMHTFEKTFNNTKSDVKRIAAQRKQLKRNSNSAGKEVREWSKKLDDADDKLMGTEKAIFDKTQDLRKANEDLHYANRARSSLELEITAKANNFARANERLGTVARYLQYGGLSMGAVWLFSGFNAGPAEQVRAVSKVAGVAHKAAGKTKDFFVESHKGRPPVDELVEDRIESVKFTGFLRKNLEDHMKDGKDPSIFLARNFNTKEGREMARKMGLTEKVQKLIADGKVKVKAATEKYKEKGQSLTSRAKKAVREKLKTS